MVTQNRPHNVTVLTVTRVYELGRPQHVFGPTNDFAPPEFDNELIEEVATVFDNLIYDESGGGNDGFVLIESEG